MSAIRRVGPILLDSGFQLRRHDSVELPHPLYLAQLWLGLQQQIEEGVL